MYFEFEESQAEAMGAFAAKLTRESIAYVVKTLPGGWRITLTGF